MIVQLMQVKANLAKQDKQVDMMPEEIGIETAIQLRLLVDKLYALLTEAHEKGLGYLLPVAFRIFHEEKMADRKPPTFIELLDELSGQELLDFEHATGLIFGDEPEPDIDEPKEIVEDDGFEFPDLDDDK